LMLFVESIFWWTWLLQILCLRQMLNLHPLGRVLHSAVPVVVLPHVQQD
jgi:hypothetical protein